MLTKPIIVKFEGAVRERIAQVARKNGLTSSAYVRQLVMKEIDRQDKGHE